MSAQRAIVNDKSPIEVKMAVIDAKSREIQQSAVSPYATLLDFLDRKCTEPRTDIGNIAVKSAQILTEKGIKASSLSVLKMLELSTQQLKAQSLASCARVAAAFVTAAINR
jgi:hypothetical protein